MQKSISPVRRPFPSLQSVAAFLLALFAFGLVSCATTSEPAARKPYQSPAYKANNPSDVVVKVSTSNQAVYVMEGDRVLLVTACCVGTPQNPTPMGNFRLTSRTKERRKYSWGYLVDNANDSVRTGKPHEARGGEKYVGYPLGYWSALSGKPAYGFHAGWVWPFPKSHGCIRLHFNVAPKFFALTRSGTRVNIATSQAEDATIGKDLARPQDYEDPEFPMDIQLSNKIFNLLEGPLFEEGDAPTLGG